jgi:hypothetical protein
LGLHIALNDLTDARALVDDRLINGPNLEYWHVQDLYLDLLEQNVSPMELDPNGLQSLQSIAATRKHGYAHAQAWLMLFGYSFDDNVVLPKEDRLYMQQEQNGNGSSASTFLDVMPNPSNGPVALAVRLPEGSEHGTVRVLDPLGRLVIEQSFTGNVQLIELDTKGLGSGVFAAQVKADGILVGTTKFEILR